MLDQCQNESHTSNGASNSDDSGWLRYEQALKKTGYFRGFMEGSKPYQDLLKEAKEFFKVNLQPAANNSNSRDSFSWKQTICREVKNLVQNADVNLVALNEESVTLPLDDGKFDI